MDQIAKMRLECTEALKLSPYFKINLSAEASTFMKRIILTLTILALLLITSLETVASNTFQVEQGATLRRLRLPILMYHYVSELPPHADEIRRGLTVTPSIFKSHMQYLHDQGYNTISLYDLYDALTNGKSLPPKSIILTFDDGYEDAYTNVFPILKQFGFIGTFFIITSRPDANDPNYMSWQQIAEMSRAGMSMEPHTKDHLDLRQRDHDFLIYQMKGSIESLKAYTGRIPRMFDYPVGHYDAATLQVAKELGVWIGVSTANGDLQTTSGRLHLPRLRIAGNMSVAALASILRH
ncbi:MAG: polysaccharide deacetylase family protein [Anaerolineaceae bacterium]|nr:polysaccharide deacetylase family protein [Anaerolineaceae bacterium]